MEKITESNANPVFGKNIGKDYTPVPANLWNAAVDYVRAFLPTAGNIVGNLTGNVTGSVTGGVTVANEATDTTCFPTFVTAATGALAPKSNANLTFNSNTATLACTNINATTFTGALVGSATAIPYASANLALAPPTQVQMVAAFGAAANGKVGIYYDTDAGGVPAPVTYLCMCVAGAWYYFDITTAGLTVGA